MISKKTKYGLIILLTVIVAGCAIFVYLDNTLKSTFVVHTDMQIYQEVFEIENDSDVIATVRVTPNVTNYMEYDSDRFPLWYWTEREVVITKSIKGEVMVGDTLTVIEPYAIGENKVIGKIEMTTEQYTNITEDEEYIMFLMKREDGKFMIVGKDQGKLMVAGKDQGELMVKKSKERSTNLVDNEFEEFHQKIRAKYE